MQIDRFRHPKQAHGQKSDERISVGLKCFCAKVDLPEPEAPIRITSEGSGILISISFNNHIIPN